MVKHYNHSFFLLIISNFMENFESSANLTSCLFAGDIISEFDQANDNINCDHSKTIHLTSTNFQPIMSPKTVFAVIS